MKSLHSFLHHSRCMLTPVGRKVRSFEGSAGFRSGPGQLERPRIARLHRLQPRTGSPAGSGFSAGMGFYAAVWPLVGPAAGQFPDRPAELVDHAGQLRQQGHAARSRRDAARGHWNERGPTWSSVFQTVEGGLGYWAGNHFRYGPPKFSMNATPQCYDYEVGSPGWSFFYSNEALPDNRLGIAQLSNRLLIPPDALPFQGNPNGEFLGYTWMALPFTDPTTGDPPTGDQSLDLLPERRQLQGTDRLLHPGDLEQDRQAVQLSLHLRARARRPAGHHGRRRDGDQHRAPLRLARTPRASPIPSCPSCSSRWTPRAGRLLVQDVTYYSKAALYDAFKAWRDGGPACSGRFDEKGAWKPKLTTRTTRFDQGGKKITGVEQVFDTRIFEGNVWGLEWFDRRPSAPRAMFPQYFKHVGDERVAVPAADVPAETQAPRPGVQAGRARSALHVADRRRLEPARPEARPVHGPARRRLAGDLLLVSLRGPALLPAIRLERREEGEAAGVRREAPRALADRPGLHGAAHAGDAGDARSGLARDAAPGAGGRIRAHRHAGRKPDRRPGNRPGRRGPAAEDDLLSGLPQVVLLLDPGVGLGQPLAERRRRLPAQDAPDHRVVGVAAADAQRLRQVVAALDLDAGDLLDHRQELVDRDQLAASPG
ncbi:MAG: hypothetical protein MZV63_13635 [Marinilabiliales bacterium]|nr:hypothetical protein [Marinilabiliales bacterium]